MVRAAAKNHASVAIVTSPARYPAILAAFEPKRGGILRPEARAILAAARVRHGLDSVGLHDMDVTVTRLHQPIRAETGTIWAARAGTSSAP